MTTATKHEVIARLTQIYEKAVRERTGVSLLLSADEAQAFSAADLEKIKEETGYNTMCGN